MYLNNMFWRSIARFIVRHPRIIELIMANAMTKPYFHLDGYMDRWWLTPQWMLGTDEYGNPFPKWWVPYIFCIRLHHILREDRDRHLHDHPFDNRSIILAGCYDEQDIFGHSNMRWAGDTVMRRAECFHKIAYVPADGTWSLWWVGDKRNRWGFLVDGRKLYYKDYFERFGITQ